MSDERRSPTDGKRLAVVSVVIALLSLGTSLLQNLNYARSIDSVQRNVLRTESLRTCKELIDIFFRFRLKAETANMTGSGGMAVVELKGLAYQFGALGTFLANFRVEVARERYTALTWQLNRIAEEAARLPNAEFAALFNEADKQFAAINDDCVKAATGHLL
jgi:hypothetical protein